MNHYPQEIDVISLGEWLNTAVGWLLGLTFLILLLAVLFDKSSPSRQHPSARKPTKSEEQRDER